MKAILVLEMPRKCEECNFHQYGICHAVRKCIVGTLKELKSKPDWCPLKPMPVKKEKHNAMPFEIKHYIDGYNTCIGEILGDKE